MLATVLMRLSSTFPTIVAVLAVVAPLPAQASCALNYPMAVSCFDPESAAQAWRINRRDPHALDNEYNRAVFARAGCQLLTAIADPKEPLYLATAAEMLTPEGRVRVLMLSVRNRAYGDSAVWVAADYITGSCERMPKLQ